MVYIDVDIRSHVRSRRQQTETHQDLRAQQRQQVRSVHTQLKRTEIQQQQPRGLQVTIQNALSGSSRKRFLPSAAFCWTSRGHTCLPFPPPVHAFMFRAHGVQHSRFSASYARRFLMFLATNSRSRAFRS